MKRCHFICLILCLLLAFASASAQVLSFGGVNVGTAAAVQNLTYTFSAATTLSAVNILTMGAPGLDYTDGGSSTCTAGATYGTTSANQSCTVTVAFAPSAPGLRAGAVTLFAQGSTLPLMTRYLNGTGQSGAVTIDPGRQSTIATLASSGQGYGLAVDGAGNVYVVDYFNSQVIQLAAGTFTPSTLVSSGLSNPTAVALDGAGNLYICDTGHSRVVMVPNEQGTLNIADLSTVSTGVLGSPRRLAMDGSGDLYIADAANGNVIETPAGGGTPITIASGLTNPYGVAVDAAGNVYVAGNNLVAEYQPPFTGTPIAVGSGFNNPSSVAVDASGAVYVADTGNAQIVRVAPGGASQASLITGLIAPQGVALDSADNVYITDSGNVYKVNRTQASALVFASTYVGSTSAPQTLTVSNAGNQTLTVSNLALTASFTQVPSGGTDCSSSTQLSSSAQCLIAVALAPTISGPFAGTFTLADNALNNSASAQAVQLSGAGLQVAQTITFPPIPTQTYGGAAYALSATATSGLPVSYAVTSGSAIVSGNALMITGGGSVTVQANQAGNAQYALATPVSQSFIVNPASQAITVTQSAPSSAAYNSTFTVVATASSGLPVSFSSSGVCTNVGATFTMTNSTGSCTVTASQPGNGNYRAAPVIAETTTAAKAAQTVSITGVPISTAYESTFTVVATSNSGITPAITANGVCSMSGTTVTMTSPTGTCTTTASWAANTDYLAASVKETTTAVKITPTVTLTGVPATAPYQSTFTVAATSNSGVTPTLTLAGSCSISGATVTMTSGTGKCTTTASWAANNYYLAASVTRITTAQKEASIVSWATPVPITYPAALSATQLDATANVAGKFAYSPAAGTVLTVGSQTLSVQFTPTSTNYAPSTGSVTLTVKSALVITSPNSTSFVVGTNGSFTVTTVGYPTPALSETGSLPTGVTFTDNGNGTGTLQGTPASTASGVFTISFTAQNGASSSVQSFMLTVGQVSAMAAARFLEQSSWGPTPATIAQVQQVGFQTYLQQQFSPPVSTYPTPSSTDPLTFVQQQFFVNAIQGPDQLRQRVSFALSEIMVVSYVKGGLGPPAFSLWMNTLQSDSFGNFYNLLNDVTLSPAMGYYLDMGNNNGCTYCRPNENYAREVQQLFTIGLDELNIDGTLQLDQNGNPIPTYTQNTVIGFSQVFTGWSYPPAPGQSAVFGKSAYFSGPMLPYNANHSKGSKVLLNGTTLPAGGNIQADLTSGLQNIFGHPNVAPFICQRLIQKLVTSNPSPAYVSRVAQVFNNDGNGIAGNMQAVVTAILLDPEARRGDDPAQVQPSDGHLREPLLHMLTAMRAVNATTGGTNLNVYASGMLQAPFMSPDVFNFYPPNFQVPDTPLLGPEFDILDASTAVARINFISNLIYKTVGPNTTINISPYVSAAGNVGNLLALVNTNIMHGQMPSDMYNTLFTTLSSPAFTNPTIAAEAALYLTLSSSQFQVEH